nr:hypothetical protein [Staphylococcus gallinarum]
MLFLKIKFQIAISSYKRISIRIGDNQLATNSVSLLLLESDFEHEVFDKLLLAILKHLDRVSLDNINHKEILELIDNTIPGR